MPRDAQILHVGLQGEHSYGEVHWREGYKVPGDPPEGDACDQPLARNLILLTVAVACEEILDFCLSEKPRLANWSITLGDFAIRRL